MAGVLQATSSMDRTVAIRIKMNGMHALILLNAAWTAAGALLVVLVAAPLWASTGHGRLHPWAVVVSIAAVSPSAALATAVVGRLVATFNYYSTGWWLRRHALLRLAPGE
jgi:hypothetical protein